MLAFLLVPGLHGCDEPRETTPPNFVLIIADDLGWNDTTPYGHPSVHTPNLERLAAEGMRFEYGFVTISSCSPSRSSIITGRYPHNTGAEQLHQPLPKDQVTFVELLREAGYWTAAAGKWHLGDAAKDHFDVVLEGGRARDSSATEDDVMPGGDDDSGAGAWVALLRDRPPDRPFFLWLASYDPHRPYYEETVPEPHGPEDVVVPPYLPDTPEVRRDLARYYDEVARLDRYVGDVLNELERQEVASHTFVLFISDNGRPFPRAKTTVYDSGIRTPWIVRWPGHVAAGRASASLVSTVDIAPTMTELAGLAPAETFQGKSFAPILEGPGEEIRDYVFAEKNWHDFDDRVRAVRNRTYKYIRNFYADIPNSPPADAVRSPTFQTMRRLRDRGELTPEQRVVFTTPRPEEELYVVSEDPYELNNIAGDSAYASVLAQMRDVLAAWQVETNDSPPEQRTADEYDRETGDPLPTRRFDRRPRSEGN